MSNSMTDALREALAGVPSMQQETDAAPVEEKDTETTTEDTEGDTADESLAASEEEGDEITDISQIPDYLGIDQEAFEGLDVVLAEGRDPVPLAKLKEMALQHEGETARLAQERTQIEEREKALQQQAMQYGQGSQVVSQRMQAAMGTLSMLQNAMPELEKSWGEREKAEPGQVALERQRIGQQASEAQMELQAAEAEVGQQQQQARGQWMLEQHRALSTAIPEWNDDSTRGKLQGEIAEFAASKYGVRPEEMARIDARTVLMLRDAMAGVKARDGADAAVKKVRAAPKAKPRGVRIKNAQHSRQRVQELEKKAQSSRTRRDVIAATRGILEESSTGRR